VNERTIADICGQITQINILSHN